MSKKSELFKGIPDEAVEKTEYRKQPDWTKPMLATLTKKRFSREDWIYERKLDGERCLVFKRGKKVRMVSRNKKSLNQHYPELVEELEKQDKSFVADGEVVAFEDNRTSFSRLQSRMHTSSKEEAGKSGVTVYYYLFDLLHLEGYDVTKMELRHRKKLLKKSLDFEDHVRYLPHRNTEGEKYHKQACKKGWEGVIAKKADSTYAHTRSKNWLKFKCGKRQEFVIGGFTDPKGERKGFGALLIGYYDDDDLVYAGKVGTGFDNEMLKTLSGKLKRIEIDDPPFDWGDPPRKGIHWVKPKLVGEAGFTEWTEDGKLRHPRFKGLREDKKAEKVVREG
jgi:DNA ligase D-like protein (predicted ligase)